MAEKIKKKSIDRNLGITFHNRDIKKKKEQNSITPKNINNALLD